MTPVGVLIGAIVVVALVVTAALILAARGRNAASSAATKCSAGVALTVVADPSVAPVITDIANQWVATKPIIDSACPSVAVRSVASADEAAALTKADTTPPGIWIPASSLWVDRVRAANAGTGSAANSLWLYPPIATSPLVLATTAATAAPVREAAAKGWKQLFIGASKVATADPATDSAGLAAVTSAHVLLDGDVDTPSRQLVNSFVALAPASVQSSVTGLGALSERRTTAQAVVTSEQAATRGGGSTPLVAVYPSGSAVGLDWPVAQFTPPGGDPATRNATVALVNYLSGSAARQRLRGAGFRDAAGHPLSGAPEVSALPRPTVDQQTAATRTWTAAGRTSRTLVVIDLSGSMSETIGGGQTKIQFAAEAELAAIKFFPDSSSLGLWGFAVDRTPTTDWKVLVPLGPLSGKVGATTRRAALVAAARSLPSLTNGNTGLYATTLAAYESVRSGFDPASVNSVVLLSDGANTDTRGVDLPALLSRLRSESNPRRPLPIITIAVGQDADTATLDKISKATGGAAYTAAEPADIRNAFLDAIIKAG
ncbi:MAG: substrate-binding and VWA domain-containing protein [Actinomycetota bacterium]|nr:substrate-binding and VWA domain-containing protein [Actinomycetota bacterium]